MTAYSADRAVPKPLGEPLTAATLSLAAVTGFTVLLGAIFLPAEARRVHAPRHVSVTHMLLPEPGAASVALFWSIPETGPPGWQHHLVLGGVERPLQSQSGPATLQPLKIARVPVTHDVLVGDWDGSLYLLNAETPAPLVLLGRQTDGGVVDVVASHDGRYALSQNAFSLYGWDLATQKQLWSRSDVRATCLLARPDSDTALIADLDGGLIEIDLATGDTLGCLAHFESPLVALSMGPSGEMLAALFADGQLQLLNNDTLAQQWTVPTGWHTASGRFIAFSPTGDSLITTDRESARALAVWDIAERVQVGRLVGHENVVLGAAFSADGALWSWGADGTIRSWNVRSRQPLSVIHVAPPQLTS